MTAPKRRRVVLAVAGGALGSAFLVSTSPMASYLVRMLTALAVAVVLVVRSRVADELRVVRRLFAAGIAAASATGVAAAVYLVVTGEPVPIVSVWDLLELAYVPFVMCGLLCLPVRRRGTRVGALADGVMTAAGLWYLALQAATMVPGMGPGTGGELFPVTLVYVLAMAFTLATLGSVYSRVDPRARPFLRWNALGIALIMLAAAGYFLRAAQGTYEATGPVAQLYQLGLCALLLAALTDLAPSSTAPQRGEVGQRVLRDVVLPYGPVMAPVVVGVVRYLQGRSFAHSDLAPLLVLGVAVMVRHVVSAHEQRLLVRELEASEQVARAETKLDPLTGLANRRGLVERLEATLADPACHPVGIAILDLNDFKDVNDTHGHATGDLLLAACAVRLRDAGLSGAVVARLGGDEFAVCQPQVAREGRDLADVLATAFKEPVTVGRQRFVVRPSIGVVIDERQRGAAKASDAVHLLAHADVAMYQAKADKDVRHAPAVVLTGVARHAAAARIRLREEVSDPDLRQFVVHYQPVVDLHTGVICGVEALLRWNHPDLGTVSPAHFIPMAEQVGSMSQLGAHVLQVAARDLARWQTLVPTLQLSLGVNLSPRQLSDPDLTRLLQESLERHGLRPEQLVLEITEGALMEDLDAAAATVNGLRGLGFSVAIDDYGTGYSSLRYLRRFEADVLKIDREFVGGLDDERTVALVRSVVELAGTLELDAIAEGIETVEQLQACVALGCRFGQGYLFSPAVSASQVTTMLLSGTGFDVGVPRPAAAAQPSAVAQVPAPRRT